MHSVLLIDAGDDWKQVAGRHNISGVVFVMDASQNEYWLKTSYQQFVEVTCMRELRQKPTLLLGNKCDNVMHLAKNELAKEFGTANMLEVEVQMCGADDDSALMEGFARLVRHI